MPKRWMKRPSEKQRRRAEAGNLMAPQAAFPFVDFGDPDHHPAVASTPEPNRSRGGRSYRVGLMIGMEMESLSEVDS
jgi:hypothetical protein